MSRPILACLDGSSHTISICDHAAWFARQTGSPITLLHVAEQSSAIESSERPLEAAARHLKNYNVADPTQSTRQGSFIDIAAELSETAQVVILGKRGVDATKTHLAFGTCVEALMRKTATPILLVSDTHLPLKRALVLLDAVPDHRRTVETVGALEALEQLSLELLVVFGEGEDPEPKLNWAKTNLRASAFNVSPAPPAGSEKAVAAYLRERDVDLLIMSRELALHNFAAPLQRLARESIWTWRLPILVC